MLQHENMEVLPKVHKYLQLKDDLCLIIDAVLHVCVLTIDVVHGESVGEVGQVGFFSKRSFLNFSCMTPVIQTLDRRHGYV